MCYPYAARCPRTWLCSLVTAHEGLAWGAPLCLQGCLSWSSWPPEQACHMAHACRPASTCSRHAARVCTCITPGGDAKCVVVQTLQQAQPGCLLNMDLQFMPHNISVHPIVSLTASSGFHASMSGPLPCSWPGNWSWGTEPRPLGPASLCALLYVLFSTSVSGRKVMFAYLQAGACRELSA
jgi:hypothetical protein